MEIHKNINPVNRACSIIVFLHSHRIGENIDLAYLNLYLYPGVEGLFRCQ